MFMKNLMKGRMPKTEEDIKQEKQEEEMKRKQTLKPSEDLIRTVQKKVQPILNELKLKGMQESTTEFNFSNQKLVEEVKYDDNAFNQLRLVGKKSESQYQYVPAVSSMSGTETAANEKWKKSKEEFEAKIKQIEESKGTVVNHNYLNLFGVERGKCEQPQCKKICSQYRGSYNIKSYQGVELFSCLNCKCPMNSHQIPKSQQSFSNVLSEELSNKYIESTHLNFKALTAIFLVWPEDEEKEDQWSKLYPIPEKKQRKQIKKEPQYSADLEKLVQVFNEGCFDILSYYDCGHQALFEKLVEKKIFSIKKPVPKQEMDNFLVFMKSFQKAENTNVKKKKESMRNLLNNEHNLAKYQLYTKYKDKIQKKFDNASSAQDKPIEEAKVYVLLVSSKYSNPYTQFRRFLVAASKHIPAEFVYYYSSKYKYKGIIDSQQFFPDFFKINYQTFILAQHIPKKVLLQARSDLSISKERLEIKLDEVKEREIKKNDDKLRDYLDFNNFVIIEEDFSQTQGELGKAFDFIDEDELTKNQFFQFCQVGTKTLNLKICAKIGPPTYTTIGSEAPNVYRITDEYDNENIASHLCEILNYSQRVAVILRPIIVKSKMDEVLINTFRLNNFIVVNRVFTLLTNDQAKLLARLEGIADKNIINYVNMMREGIVQIVLLTKPGGVKSVQFLSNGCTTGLKLQNTNYLDDLYVYHEQGGVKFKEKINKQFYNVFQSYTNLNMFTGIKEFFNIEKLIFSDENNDEEELNNIFINTETDQVHYSLKNQNQVSSGKRFTAIKKSQIIDAINNERFNFFIYCPNDELSTEQIISVFMPECANIELIHVVLKPQYLMYVSQVKQQLEKLRYKVWNIIVRSIPSAQDAKYFIESLSVIKNSGEGSGVETFYSTEEFAIFSCVKPAGRKEMLSFLQDFKVEYIKDVVNEPITTQSLKYMLIPCHTDLSHDLAQQYIHPKSRQFSGSEFNQMNMDDKLFCAQYMLETTFASSLSKENPKSVLKEKAFKNPLYSTNFYHYTVKSEDLGIFEIRIFDFNTYKGYEINFGKIQEKFKLLSWYYSLINREYMQRCPLSYQYRLMPENRDFSNPQSLIKQKLSIPTHVFDVSEYCGGFFLETVAEQMNFYRNYEMSEMQLQILRQKGIKSYRGSVAAYLWGMRLAKFVKEMESVEFPNIDGFGEIQNIEGTFQGEYVDNENLFENLQKKYTDILERIKKELEVGKEQSGQSDFNKIFEQLKNKIETLCKHEVFKYSKTKKMRRIFPSFVENENLRVRVDARQIHKRSINKDYHTQDEFFEKRSNEINLKEDIKKLEDVVERLSLLENLENETTADTNLLKRHLKNAETNLDALDLKKRQKFLDEDTYMILLIHHITLKSKKVKSILNRLLEIEEEDKRIQFEQNLNKSAQEEEEEEEFSLKKHEIFVDSIAGYLQNLNEKYNGKNGTFNLRTATRINTFSFAYVEPEIKSKYYLVANILFLLEVQFSTVSTKYHLTSDDQVEYKQLISAIEEGFKTHYNPDQEDIAFQREKYQDQKFIQRDKKVFIPDFIKVEQFFMYLTQMEKYLSLVEEKRNILKKILDDHMKELREFKNKMAAGRQNDEELKKIEEKWGETAEKVSNDKTQIEKQIQKLLNLVIKFNTDFNYDDSMKRDTTNQDRKKEIEKRTYYQKIDNAFEYFESNPDLDIFQVDIMDVKYKFEFGEEKPNMKKNQDNIQIPLLEKHGDKDFLKDALEDPLQKNWFNTSPLFISHMRPIKAEDKNTILVEEQRQEQKSESEKAIEREIRRFKIENGFARKEEAEEQVKEQQLKNQDYQQYKLQQLKKEEEQQKQLDERYSLSNPDRDKNYAEDLVNKYWNQIEEEKKKLKEERLYTQANKKNTNTQGKSGKYY